MAANILREASTLYPSEPESAPTAGADFSFRAKRYQKGLQFTPIDELTGIALPIVPYDGQYLAHELSDHHAAHERNRKELIGHENGVVTRTARMQKVVGPGGGVIEGGRLTDWHMPHQRYHYFCSGPEQLPSNDDERFTYGVWAGSLYVPEYGLDVSGKKLKVKKLRPDQIEKLHSGQIYIGSLDTLRMFLRQYVMDKGVPQIDGKDIDSFLAAKDIEVKIELGRRILSLATRAVTEPIQVDFERAARRGRVSPLLGRSAFKAVMESVVYGNQQKLVRQLSSAVAA